MLINGVGRYRKGPCNFLGRKMLHYQPQTITLARCQLIDPFHMGVLMALQLNRRNHMLHFATGSIKMVMLSIMNFNKEKIDSKDCRLTVAR
jgi:hypothetical protein